MSSSLPHDLIRDDVARLPTYNAGLALDRFKATYGINCLAKLDSNESLLGPAPLAVQAMPDTAATVGHHRR